MNSVGLTKEQILEIVKSNEWDTQGFNAYPLYLMCAATESGWLVKDKLGAGYTHFFYFFSKGRAYMYYDRKDWQNICDAYYKKVVSQAQLEELVSDYQARYQQLLKDTAYDESKLEGLSLEELIKMLKVLCERLMNAVGSAHAIEGITYGSEKKLREILTKKGTFTEEEFGLICSPTHPSFLFEAQKALRLIKLLPENEKPKAIDVFIENFGWIENTYLGRKRFTHADVLHRIEGLKPDSDTANPEKVLSEKQELLKKFDLSPEEKFVIETIDLCFHWQDERKKYILQSVGALEPVLDQVAKKVGTESADLKFANIEEIGEEKLKDDSFLAQLKIRREKSVYYTVPGQNFVFTGEDNDYFTENLHVALDNDVKEIKGSVASPGKVSGIVRVCESVSDIDKVQSGEILVASMTRPEYLPAMQRAAGFITDEGGITCHAAIVSRELKKPCIIGTKIATKVLKDGDMVEVDAEKGIVTIIK